MTQINILESGGLVSRGYLLDENTNTPMGQGGGPQWVYDLPPSNYIFECDYGGVAGKTVTVTVADPVSVLNSGTDTIPGDPGAYGAGSMWVRFTVA